MSIELIPGVDFGSTEMVSKDKLAAWIGGVYNLTGTPTAADVGADYCSVTVAPTLPSCVTEGTLVLDSTRAHMCIYTRYGFVPVALTAGALFSRRFSISTAGAVSWYNTRGSSLGLNSSAATVMTSVYYLANSTEFDHGFGKQWWGGGNLGYKPSGGPGHRMHASLYPTNEMPWSAVSLPASNTWAVALQNTPLVGFGGWRPVYCTVASGSTFCESNQTNDANAGPISIGGVLGVGSSLKLGRPSRFGFKAAEGVSYFYGYEYVNLGHVYYVSDKTAWWF